MQTFNELSCLSIHESQKSVFFYFAKDEGRQQDQNIWGNLGVHASIRIKSSSCESLLKDYQSLGVSGLAHSVAV